LTNTSGLDNWECSVETKGVNPLTPGPEKRECANVNRPPTDVHRQLHSERIGQVDRMATLPRRNAQLQESIKPTWSRCGSVCQQNVPSKRYRPKWDSQWRHHVGQVAQMKWPRWSRSFVHLAQHHKRSKGHRAQWRHHVGPCVGLEKTAVNPKREAIERWCRMGQTILAPTPQKMQAKWQNGNTAKTKCPITGMRQSGQQNRLCKQKGGGLPVVTLQQVKRQQRSRCTRTRSLPWKQIVVNIRMKARQTLHITTDERCEQSLCCRTRMHKLGHEKQWCHR
jgi:hypothetical protein